MKNKDNFISNIYNEMINTILKEIEEVYIIATKEGYRKLLLNRYSTIDINETNYDKLYQTFINLEHKEWDNLSAELKLNILVDDEHLNQMIEISGKAYQCAKTRLNNMGVISEKTANYYIEKMKNISEQVSDYNKELAKNYLSETILDLLYATGKTENSSLRISHIKNKHLNKGVN